jgi:hypothetical protein
LLPWCGYRSRRAPTELASLRLILRADDAVVYRHPPSVAGGYSGLELPNLGVLRIVGDGGHLDTGMVPVASLQE